MTVTTPQEQFEVMRKAFVEFQDRFAIAETDIQEILNAEGQQVGIRLLLVLSPTMQFVYVPTTINELGVFVFPGDDAAISVQLVTEMVKIVQRHVADIKVSVIGVIAPVFGEAIINFTQDPDTVYDIWGKVMTARVNNGKPPETETLVVDGDLVQT